MLEGLKPLYNNILRPFARFLSKIGIHPNHITITGLLFFVIAGYFCTTGQWKTALIMVIIGALMDGLDGVLARETGKKSVFGAVLDSSCDRLTEIALFLGIMIFYLRSTPVHELGVILSFGGICGSIMVSYIKARCEGAGLPCKGGILQRPERIILLCVGLLAGPAITVWILIGLNILAWFTVLQRIIEASLLGSKVTNSEGK